VYEQRFEELKSQVLLPVSSDTDRGAESIAWEIMEEVGEAQLASAGNVDDIPLVETASRKDSKLVYNVVSGYKYDINDLWAASFSGKPLNDRRARTCRRAIERRIDQVGATGIPNTPTDGLVNGDSNANVPTVANDTGNWENSGRTFTEIMQDFAKLVRTVTTNTSDIFRPNTAVLPTSVFIHLASKPLSNDNSMTVLDALRQAAQGLGITTIESWNELETAGSGSTHRMIAYHRDSEVLEYDIPLDFFQLPEQRKGIGWEVPCLARVAGVTWHHPNAAGYMDGI
jgi:hypothetical protein